MKLRSFISNKLKIVRKLNFFVFILAKWDIVCYNIKAV